MKYQDRIVHAAETLALPTGEWEAKVYHDDWCRQLAGKGDCDCRPDITIEGEHGLWAVDATGNPRMQRGRS
ncbi:MAG: hypothetical protein JSS23_11225 [Proteobacteria bacterium]|nr:hypothetical protein [Pseudomonadota bacterium]